MDMDKQTSGLSPATLAAHSQYRRASPTKYIIASPNIATLLVGLCKIT